LNLQGFSLGKFLQRSAARMFRNNGFDTNLRRVTVSRACDSLRAGDEAAAISGHRVQPAFSP
jgi:hypothetical protein